MRLPRTQWEELPIGLLCFYLHQFCLWGADKLKEQNLFMGFYAIIFYEGILFAAVGYFFCVRGIVAIIRDLRDRWNR